MLKVNNKSYKINKYLTEIKEELKESFYEDNGDNAKQILLESPTGSGKTKCIADIFNENDKTENVNILLVPKRAQAEQNKKYSLFPIVAKSEPDMNCNSFCVVYDKAKDFKDILKNNYENRKINIVVDEAHQLISSSLYRKSCIEQVLSLIDFANDSFYNTKKGFICYMSATTQTIKYNFTNYDEKIFVETENKNNIGNIEIIVNDTQLNILDFTKSVILNKSEKAFIRLNDKKIQKQLCEEIARQTNHVCAYVNSDEKGYKVISGNKIYDNNVYGSIIEKATIPDNIDYLFTTSMLDEGASIEKTNIEDCYFIINDINQMDIDSIIQFSNRLRMDYKNYYIVVNKANRENPIFKSYGNIYKEQRKDLNQKLKGLKMTYAGLKMTFSQKEANTRMKNELHYKDFWNCNLNTNCIFLNEYTDELYINELCYKLYCRRIYNQQYYYNLDKFKRELHKCFKQKINLNYITEIEEYKINYSELNKNRQNGKREVKKALSTLTKDTAYKLYLYMNDTIEIPEELKPIYEDKEYKSFIKKANDFNISEYILLNLLLHSKSVIRKYLYQEQIIKNNLAILEYRKNSISLIVELKKFEYLGIISIEQQIIFNKLFTFNENDYLKQTTITNEIIADIKEEIIKRCKHDISDEKVLELIGMVFRVKNDNNKIKIRDLRIQNIKLKNKLLKNK